MPVTQACAWVIDHDTLHDFGEGGGSPSKDLPVTPVTQASAWMSAHEVIL